jgi:hypothetical protein
MAGSMLDRVGEFWTGLRLRWTGLEIFGPTLDKAGQSWRPLDRVNITLDRLGDHWTFPQS